MAPIALVLAISLFISSSVCQIRLDLKAQIKAIDQISGKTFVQRQRQRVVTRLGKRSGHVQDFPAADVLNTYTAVVTIGKTDFDLLIDTGSSYTWAGSGDVMFTKSSASRDQHKSFSAYYGSGSAHGEHWKDTLMFAGSSATKMTGQGFGNASGSDNFNYADGIVGFGPTGLTAGIVDGLKTVPTVMDTLMNQKRLPAKVMSAFFAPNTNGQKAPRGTLVLGGTDNSLYTGSIVYAPQTTEGPAAQFWGAKINKFVYGSKTISSGPTGLVDTGTTLLLLPDDAFSTWLNAIPGAYVDSSSGLTLVPRSSYYKMQNLTLYWNNKPFTFIPDAQLMPPATGAAFVGDSSTNLVSIVASSGTPRYCLGMMALTRFYSVFDYAQNRLGLATTSHTYDLTAGMPAQASNADKSSSSKKATSTKHTSTKRASSTQRTSTKKPTSTKKTTSSKKITSTKRKRDLEPTTLVRRRFVEQL